MLNPVAFSCYKNLNLQKCEDSERTESRKPGKQTKGGFDLARQKDENREKAKQLFLDSDGLMKNTEIAEALGIDSAKVRKWKCVDKWNDALENKPKKRGGQKGNKNAKGHGAPVRNKNAETHGAYSKVYFDELSEDEKALIESVTLDTGENTLRELQSLIAKTTAEFTLVGDVDYVAGITVTVYGYGEFDGKYIVEQAQHSITGGYKVQIKLRSVLEGY